MELINIAIDAATHKSGIAIFHNGNLISYGVLKHSKENFNGEKVLTDISNTRYELARMLYNLQNLANLKNDVNINLYIENSFHGNMGVGVKLSLYVGIFASELQNWFSLMLPYANLKLKLITPAEWQLIAFNRKLEKGESKSLSIERAQRYLRKEHTVELTDDMADAINIASLGIMLRDNYQVKQEKRTRRDNLISLRAKELQFMNKKAKLKEKLINKKADKVAKGKAQQDAELLTFANKSELERLQKYNEELNKIKNDIKEIQEYKLINKGDKNGV